MAFKFVVFLCAVAYAKAGIIAAPAAVAYSAAPAVSHVSYASPLVSYGSHQLPTVTSQHQNILRSPGNLAQVSTYSKTIDTPYSSVSKSDVRVSNPGYVSHTYAAAPVAHYAAPVAQYAAPIAQYSSPIVTKTAYAAPVAHYAAPVAQYAAPVAHYSAPVVAKAAIAPAGLLGVAYSAAPAVSHMTYSNGLGLTYGW